MMLKNNQIKIIDQGIPYQEDCNEELQFKFLTATWSNIYIMKTEPFEKKKKNKRKWESIKCYKFVIFMLAQVTLVHGFDEASA